MSAAAEHKVEDHLIKKSSIKYPIMYMAGYLAIQMFIILNIILYATKDVGTTAEFANDLFGVVWGAGNIFVIFTIKLSDRWGYTESLILTGIFQALAFFVISIPTKATLLLGCALYGAGMVLAISQNYVILSGTMKKSYTGRFNVFLLSYAVMNATAFLAGIISGFSNELGFTLVFRISGILSLIMLVYVLIFFKKIEFFEGSNADKLHKRPASEKMAGFIKLLITAVVVTVVLLGLVYIASITNILIDISVLAVFLYLVYLGFTHHGAARAKIFVFLFFSLMSMIFWVGYNMYEGQAYTNILEYDSILHGLAVQWVLAVDALVIILFGVFFAIGLNWLADKKGINFNAIMRLIIGLWFLALGMSIIILGFWASGFKTIDVYWVIAAIFFCAVGEIFAGPTGSAVAGQCAPEKLEGTLISVGFIILGGTGAISAAITNWMMNKHTTVKTVINHVTHSVTVYNSHHISMVIAVFIGAVIIAAILLMIFYKTLTEKAGFDKFFGKAQNNTNN